MKRADIKPADLGIGRLFERVRDAVIVADAETQRIVLWNPAATRIFGYSEEEALGLLVEALVPQALKESHRRGMIRYRKTGRGEYINSQVLLDLPALKKDGGEISVEMSLSPVEIPDLPGGRRFALAILRDTTARKRTEELRSRLTAIVESSDDAIIGKTLDGIITSWNAGAEEIYGYTAREVDGLNISLLSPKDRPDEVPAILERMRRGEKVDHYETVRVAKDGRHIHVSLTVSPVKNADGNVTGAASIARDVTKRREAEELRRQKDFYETLLRIQSDMGEGLLIASRERIVYSNEAFSRISGYSPTELAEMPSYLDLIAAEERALARESLRHPETLLDDHYEATIITKSGKKVDLEVAVKTFTINGDTQLVAITSDITERKRAEESLRRSLNALLTLHESSRVFNATLERDEIARRLLQMSRHVSGLEAAAIYLRDEDGVRPWHTSGREDLRERAGAEEEVGAARAAVLETGERRIVELRLPNSEEDLVDVCLPLRVRDWSIGVLEVFVPPSLGEDSTVELLGSLANQAASALENARLYEELADHEHRLRVLVGKLIAAQEEERTRVAYEVHDGPTQVAIAAHQHLQAFADEHPPGSTVKEGELDRALELVRRTVVETRHVIEGLRPTVLDDFGLATALRMYVSALRAESWEITFEDNLADERLPVEVETALYRVAQEALTNVRKHAHTKRARLTLNRSGRMLRMEVRDYGEGFDPTETQEWSGPGERVGLSSMQERVALIGGRFGIHSRPEEGTSVVAEVPLPATGESVG